MTSRRKLGRPGLTLIELVLVLAITGIGAMVAGASIIRGGAITAGFKGTCRDSLDQLFRRLRTEAVMNRRRISTAEPNGGTTVQVTALPDGRILSTRRDGTATCR